MLDLIKRLDVRVAEEIKMLTNTITTAEQLSAQQKIIEEIDFLKEEGLKRKTFMASTSMSQTALG